MSQAATSEKEIKPIAIPQVHDRFYPFFKELTQYKTEVKVLDVGAGHGAFTKKLHEEGYDIAACDLFPEIFYYDEVECKKADLTQPLPYEDNSFDIIIAIEVMEHILDHEVFFRECSRILKKGGSLVISTPNILSLKSRWRFLFSGFFYSFKPLDLNNNDGLQHVASLTLDQYHYLAIRNGLKLGRIEVDKRQNTSRWLLFLYPFIWLFNKRRNIDLNIHNQMKLLTGRILFAQFPKA
ncbi:MAG: class I SAM-dependent methyltransferase [Bacteroidota bacterium]